MGEDIKEDNPILMYCRSVLNDMYFKTVFNEIHELQELREKEFKKKHPIRYTINCIRWAR